MYKIKIGILALLFAFVFYGKSFAQANNPSGALGGYPLVTNPTVGASPVKVIPADGTNLDWSIYDETTGSDIRCVPIVPGITNPPTTSYGFRVVGGGNPLRSYPFSDPTMEWDCISLSGTATLSVNIDKRKY